MYSAEITGDEEDEEISQKNLALSEEETCAKRAKKGKQFKWLLYVTVAFVPRIVVSVPPSMLPPYALKSLQKGWRFGICSYNSWRHFVKACIVYGIYASDFQNEGYSENIYVSWSRA